MFHRQRMDQNGSRGARDAGHVVMFGEPETAISPALDMPGEIEGIAVRFCNCAALFHGGEVKDGVRNLTGFCHGYPMDALRRRKVAASRRRRWIDKSLRPDTKQEPSCGNRGRVRGLAFERYETCATVCSGSGAGTARLASIAATTSATKYKLPPMRSVVRSPK